MSAAQQAMMIVQVTATANKIMGDAFEREIAAGQATQGAHLTETAAEIQNQIVIDGATGTAVVQDRDAVSTLTAATETRVSAEYIQAQAAQALALSHAEGERQQAAMRAEAQFEPYRLAIREGGVPLLLGLGGMSGILILCIMVGQGLRYRLQGLVIADERTTVRTERENQVTQPFTTQPIQPFRVELKRGNQLSYPAWAQRLGEARLEMLAKSLLANSRLTYAEWVGKGKPFTRATFHELQNGLVADGMAAWKNPDNHDVGIEITDAGWEFFEKWE